MNLTLPVVPGLQVEVVVGIVEGIVAVHPPFVRAGHLERPQTALILPDMGFVVCQVHVELRGWRAEGIVSREHGDLVPAARDDDGVLVVMPAHPGHLGEDPGLGVQHDYIAALALGVE